MVSTQEEKRYGELQALALDFARNGETQTLESMIRSGLSVNLSDTKGNTLLMLAAYNGELETTQMLLTWGAKVNQRNDRGQTPLGGVAFKGYIRICKVLVEAGAKVNADNGGGRTPIMFAALFGRVDVVQYLQEVGACNVSQTLLGISVAKVARTVRFIKNIFTCKDKRSVDYENNATMCAEKK